MKILLVLLLIICSCTQNKKEIGNVLRVPVITKIKGFDPAHADDVYSHTAIKQVYETLLQYHHLKRPYKLVPLIAEKMPRISDNGLVYTFNIKKGIYFQDDPCFNGKKRELVAQDVVYSIKRIADIKVKSTGWWLFEDRIKGLDDFRKLSIESNETNYSKTVEGLYAKDKYTLVIKLKSPCPQFKYFFAMAFTSIVPKEAVDYYGKEFLNHPVGTGPFKLIEWRRGLRLKYAKNPNYVHDKYPDFGVDKNKTLPFIDTLVMNIFVESQPMWLNFIRGNLDLSGIPKDNFNKAVNQDMTLKSDMKKKGIILSVNPSLDLTYTAFNMEDKMLGKNVHLRRAFCYAWDVEKVIRIMYNNRAILAHSPIPPGLLGYEEDFKNPYQKFSVDSAKKELERAGFKGGKGLSPFKYLTTDNTTSRQWSEKFVKEMSDVGIIIDVEAVTWPEYLKRIKTKQFQIAGMAWGADYPDPENFLQLLYGPNEAPGSNNSNYKNSEYDSLYKELLLVKEKQKKLKIIQRMKEVIVNDCPWIFNTHRLSTSLRYDWVKNTKYNDVSPGNYKYIKIDVLKRNRSLGR